MRPKFNKKSGRVIIQDQDKFVSASWNKKAASLFVQGKISKDLTGKKEDWKMGFFCSGGEGREGRKVFKILKRYLNKDFREKRKAYRTERG